MKQILCKYGVAPKIAKAMGLHDRTVQNALRGMRDNELSRKIRYVATSQYGGIEEGATSYQAVEVEHDTTNRMMICRFGLRVRMCVPIGGSDSDRMMLWVDNQPRELPYSGMTIDEYSFNLEAAYHVFLELIGQR